MASSDRSGKRVDSGLPPTGLRERKKQRTRDAIQREAMRLFTEQGYDETTIEQIAEAADISPSTFFNYFPTKEDVVLADRYDPMFVSMFLDRPAGEPLSVTLRSVLIEGLGTAIEQDREMILARSRLILAVPALRARVMGDLERSQKLFCEVLAERMSRRPDDFDLRVVTMVTISALFEATQEWVRRDGRDPIVDLVRRALDLIDAGGRLDALESSATGRSRPGAAAG